MFLHDVSQEETYLRQTPGYEHGKAQILCACLKKALYEVVRHHAEHLHVLPFVGTQRVPQPDVHDGVSGVLKRAGGHDTRGAGLVSVELRGRVDSHLAVDGAEV